jgi:hypothetical protein
VTVNFVTPRTDDGAILFELKGPSLHGITPANTSLQVYIDSSSSTIRVATFGTLNSGAVVTFTIADTTTLSSYSATLVDVANRQNQLRAPLTGYELRLAH